MELLEQHFDTAFSAPNGIQKLRDLIITLALQGKLVPQEISDAPTSELLKEIEGEKKQLAKEGKIKAPKSLPEFSSADAPYALPRGWQWVRLGTVGNIFNGNSINASEKEAKYAGTQGLPYIATKDVGYGFDPLDYENGICIPANEDKFRVAHEGAVLLCAEGGSAGKKCGVTNRDICFGNKLFANELLGKISSRYILYVYLSPLFRASFSALMTGIIGGVSIAKFVEIPIPLAPLGEQDRIVAKIDQLMAHCDTLESLRNARNKKCVAVNDAAISQLLEAAGRGDTHDARNFMGQYFSEFYAVKENVAELRKAILQLALNGKLVPQSVSGENGHELLERIKNEKLELIKSGYLKKPRGEKELMGGNRILTLPGTWVATDVGAIATVVTDGTHKTPRYVDDGVRFVSAKDIREGHLTFKECKYITPEEHRDISRRCNPERGDILVSKSGSIGTVVIVDDDEEFSLFESLALIKFPANLMNGRFMYYAVRNACNFLEEHHIKGVAVKHLHLNVLRTLPIPLPPLQEQNNIVAKIDRFMFLCDTIAQGITASIGKEAELLDAVMAQV
ncbi:restriction endonuclease subunit S [Janthinobacterium tructae]